MSNTNNISLEIQNILDKNKLEDLNTFLKKRKCLNNTNSYFIYFFHFFQSAGILTTSFAAGNNNKNIVWIGITLNFLATLISIYEKINNSLLKKILNDIKLIKDGTYIDESELINSDDLNKNTDLQNMKLQNNNKDTDNQTKDNQTKDNETKDNQTKDNQTKDNDKSINENITIPLLDGKSQTYNTFTNHDGKVSNNV
jgi:hypothetical protein